ncbi:hypothetical protein, partial [Vulcanisaeta sp.]|uniref:hypothetical protein n=1 Tax=Vulcanisaeta sp. TaxID=2020871 RepID=UPI003D098EAB
MPYPGVTVKVYASANTQTPVTDTANNLLLAELTYYGPTLTYTQPGTNYNLISSSLSATYSGESGFSTPMTLSALKPSTPPNTPTAYFSFKFPEYDLPVSSSLTSYTTLQITNASTALPIGSSLYYLNYTSL